MYFGTFFTRIFRHLCPGFSTSRPLCRKSKEEERRTESPRLRP